MNQPASRQDKNKVYDPNQALQEKRAIRPGYRDLLEEAESTGFTFLRLWQQLTLTGVLQLLVTKLNPIALDHYPTF